MWETLLYSNDRICRECSLLLGDDHPGNFVVGCIRNGLLGFQLQFTFDTFAAQKFSALIQELNLVPM